MGNETPKFKTTTGKMFYSNKKIKKPACFECLPKGRKLEIWRQWKFKDYNNENIRKCYYCKEDTVTTIPLAQQKATSTWLKSLGINESKIRTFVINEEIQWPPEQQDNKAETNIAIVKPLQLRQNTDSQNTPTDTQDIFQNETQTDRLMDMTEQEFENLIEQTIGTISTQPTTESEQSKPVIQPNPLKNEMNQSLPQATQGINATRQQTEEYDLQLLHPVVYNNIERKEPIEILQHATQGTAIHTMSENSFLTSNPIINTNLNEREMINIIQQAMEGKTMTILTVKENYESPPPSITYTNILGNEITEILGFNEPEPAKTSILPTIDKIWRSYPMINHFLTTPHTKEEEEEFRKLQKALEPIPKTEKQDITWESLMEIIGEDTEDTELLTF